MFAGWFDLIVYSLGLFCGLMLVVCGWIAYGGGCLIVLWLRVCWFTASFLLDWLCVVVVLPELRFAHVCWLFIVCDWAFVCWWLLTWLWCFAVGDCVYCVG